MKLDKMDAFCAVARNMSFSKAAEECHVAQSAVSQQIRQLEEDLGFQVFERSTRRVDFTPAGQSFYQDYLLILEQLESAQLRAVAISAGKKATLSIGVEGLNQMDAQIELICRFEKKHPEARVIPKRLEPNAKYEQLASGEVDLIFDIPRYYMLNGCIAMAGMTRSEHVLMVSRMHPLATRERVSKRDLAGCTTFLGGVSNVESYLMQQYIEYFRRDDIQAQKVIYVPDENVATMLVALGQGGNLLPRMKSDWWSRERFAFVELEEPLYIESAWLYSRSNKNSALHKFLQMLGEKHQPDEETDT